MKLQHFYIGTNTLHKNIIVLISFLVIFLLISSQYENLTTIDTIGADLIQGLRTDWLTEAFIFITYLGSYYISYPLVFICTLYCLVNRKVLTGVFIFLNLAGVRYLNSFLKEFFSRERPGAEHLVHVGGLSFPSGHTMNSTAFLGFLAFLLWYFAKTSGKDVKYYVSGIILLIFLIGISRIYLGVHYPSDVLGGFAAGGVWLMLSIILFQQLEAKKDK